MKKSFIKIFSYVFFVFFLRVEFVEALICVDIPKCDNGVDIDERTCFEEKNNTNINVYFNSDISVQNYSKQYRVEVLSGNILNDISLPLLEAPGYRFEGWFYKNQIIRNIAEIRVDFYRETVTGTVCRFDDNNNYIGEGYRVVNIQDVYDDVTLEAKWTPFVYIINYHLPNGEIVKLNYSGNDTNKELLKSEENYQWYYDSNYNNLVNAKKVNQLNFTPVFNNIGYGNMIYDYEPLNLYAKDNLNCIGDNDFNLFYNINNGEEITSELIDVSSNYNEVDYSFPIPLKKGYKFDGWYYDQDYKNKVNLEYKIDLRPNYISDSNGCPIYVDYAIYGRYIMDDSFNQAKDPELDENTNDKNNVNNNDGIKSDDIPDTGANTNILFLIFIAVVTIYIYFYILKNDRIKRIF